MPFYPKGSLNKIIDSRFLTVREIISLGTNFLSGLHNIHSKRLIHFDIKPDNILISERNEAHLTDFGLAKKAAFDGAEQDRVYGRMAPPEYFEKGDKYT